jgi:hypothetical protein
MEDFKTPKGTFLPLLNLRGKAYLQVAHRLVWMREEHPDWTIMTEIIEKTLDHSIMKATIMNKEGMILATAHKREDGKHFQDHMEKAETSAIGRALAMCGYGTQFTEDLDEGDRIVDSPLSKPNPHAAKNNQPEPGDGVQFGDKFIFAAMAEPLSGLAKKPISTVSVDRLKQVIEVLTKKYGQSQWPPAAEFTVEACYQELDKRGIK